MGDPLKYHPLTGAPIAPLGYRKNGRAIYPIMGGAPDDPPGDPQDPAADPPSDPPTDPPADPGKQPPWGKPEDFNADKAWELIQNLRTEKGDPAKVAELEQTVSEMQTAQQKQMDSLAKALGLKPDDTPPDPAKLAEQITAEQGKTSEAETRAAAAERQLAVFLAAPDHDANAKALLDSTSFLDSIKGVDHNDPEKLGEAIKAAVEKDDRFKVTSPTPPFPGGPRKTSTPPDPGPGMPRLRGAYAQSSK